MSTDTGTDTPTRSTEPPSRYGAALAEEIERRWQDRWEREGTFQAPNPGEPGSEREKVYLLDMFPYPSGAGLHVGHPLGFIGTDVLGRYMRMTGHNVLHAMGFDAFGLPAEQYAVQTGTHPRNTTEANIGRYRAQLRRLGLAHDERRSVPTTDVDFYRWTQWIFLKIYGSFYDEEQRRARPVEELEAESASGTRPTPDGRPWAQLSEVEQRAVVDSFRLAYVSEAPVNWCPGLGTVLANEEVTADGRSERGNFPVFRRNLKQWMMRITAYADRLVDDLERRRLAESVTATAHDKPWSGSAGRTRSRRCSATGSAGPRARRCGSTSSALRWVSTCSPPGRTRCSAPRTWSWRPSTPCASRSSPAPGRWTRTRAGRGAPPPRRRPSRPTATRLPANRSWTD